VPKIKVPSRRNEEMTMASVKVPVGWSRMWRTSRYRMAVLSFFSFSTSYAFSFLLLFWPLRPATPGNPNIYVWRHAKYLPLLVWNKATGAARGDDSKRTRSKRKKCNSQQQCGRPESLWWRIVPYMHIRSTGIKRSSLNIRNNNHNSVFDSDRIWRT